MLAAATEHRDAETPRELARRASGGVDVALTWRPSDGAVFVAVSNKATGPQFVLRVDPADALSAYRHPYAVAMHEPWRRAEVTAP